MKKLGDLIKEGSEGVASSLEVLCEGQDIPWAKRLSKADRAYGEHKRCADKRVNIDPVKATYQYAQAASYAKSGFEILLEQRNAPLKEKLDRGKNWWEANKLAADTAPITEQKHAAYNRGFEGSAAAAVFKLINPLEEVSEKDKLLWAERWYSGCKEGADMLINTDNETAWCLYWSAKNAAEALWAKKRSLEMRKNIYDLWISLINASNSYDRFLTTCKGAEFIAWDIHRRTGKKSWKKNAEIIGEIYRKTSPLEYNNQKIYLPS